MTHGQKCTPYHQFYAYKKLLRALMAAQKLKTAGIARAYSNIVSSV